MISANNLIISRTCFKSSFFRLLSFSFRLNFLFIVHHLSISLLHMYSNIFLCKTQAFLIKYLKLFTIFLYTKKESSHFWLPKIYKKIFTSFFLFSFIVSSLSSKTPNLSNPTVIIKAMKFVPIRSIKSSVFDLYSMESNISLLLSFFSLLRSRFKFCLLWYPLNSNVIAEFKNISANITIANFLLLW